MTNKPHIVHLVGTLGAGGVQNLILDLVETPRFEQYRHSVVCLFGASGSLVMRFEAARVPAYVCTVPWPASLSFPSYRLTRWVRHRLAFTFPNRLAALLARIDADLVHTHITHSIDQQVEGVVLKARLPFVWTIHGMYAPTGRELRRWRRATRMLSERPGAVTFVAESLARDFGARGLEHGDGLRVIRGGVDIDRFSNSTAPDDGWRAHWGIPPDAVLFGAAGRLVTQKAYEVLVRAASQLVSQGATAHFAIAGDGPLRRSLEGEIRRAGIESRFHLIGFEADVASFLKRLDVFVLSSRSEGFPIALIEALASGLPAVATRVGGVTELLGDDCGLVVDPESVDQLTTALQAMMDPNVRARQARRGPAIAQGFSISRCAEDFAELYDGLLHQAILEEFGIAKGISA